MKIKSFVLGAMIVTTTISLANSTIAQDVKNLGDGMRSVIFDKPTAPPQPWFVRNQDPRRVAYGIQVKTWNPTTVAPLFQLIGTKGASRELQLDNTAANFGSGQTDYFVFSAADLTDIGVPIAIVFTSRSEDGWGFEEVSVDYFVGGFNRTDAPFTFDAHKWATTRNNWNVRNEVMTYLSPTEFSSGEDWMHGVNACENTFPMFGRAGIDDGGEYNGGMRFTKSASLSADGSALDIHKDPNMQSVTLSTEIVVIDTRKWGGELTWSSKQTQTVTSEDVRTAVDAREKSTGWANTVTVLAEASVEAAVPGLTKAAAKFSVTNAFNVNEGKKTSSSETSSEAAKNLMTSEQSQTYKIPAGSVAFIKLNRTANMTRFTDFGGMHRAGPAVSVDYFLTPVLYQVECSSGRLRQVSGSHREANDATIYDFGDYLTDQSGSEFYKAAMRGFGETWSTFSQRGAKCHETSSTK